MELSFIWKSAVLIITGILLLRVSGRKSISQMTLAQTIIMISLGTIIVQPIVEKSVIKAIGGAVVFIIAILILEVLQLKVNAIEKFITGKSKVVIENGQIDYKTLKKIRMTVDQLEMRIRTKGISSINDIQTATIEPNGQLGYELKEEAKPLTISDFKKLMAMIEEKNKSNQSNTQYNNEYKNPNIFQELKGRNNQKHNKSLK
ncbi:MULTISPECIES: DUF421 domain-containing protein [Niallia]|uniref:DUF421 domain-containing protein n=1 Tax=Niallia TaxID=2837506 RepID=UPI001EDC687E|nr:MULTISPECIES: DUF421 domain-containing protein [Niallia]MED4041182.1 DUF421 domain-containing protein [Niallia taxi]UPO91048.1 DUF421 domain-containing protein [Niallia sp. Man26]